MLDTLKSKLWDTLLYLNEKYDGIKELLVFLVFGFILLGILVSSIPKVGILMLLVIVVGRIFYLLKKDKSVE